jgi:hypothetical protein
MIRLRESDGHDCSAEGGKGVPGYEEIEWRTVVIEVW